MNVVKEMTCRELVELVTEYLEGALAPAERTRFEQHLDACRYCVTYVEQMRTTVATLGRLTNEQLSDEARAKLMSAFGGWKRPG